MIIITKTIFTENHIYIMRISGNLVSFSYSVLFSLKIFFECEDDVKHITNIDIVDDDMWFESDILFNNSDHLIDILFIINILIAQLSIGYNVVCIYTKQNFSLTFQ